MSDSLRPLLWPSNLFIPPLLLCMHVHVRCVRHSIDQSASAAHSLLFLHCFFLPLFLYFHIFISYFLVLFCLRFVLLLLSFSFSPAKTLTLGRNFIAKYFVQFVWPKLKYTHIHAYTGTGIHTETAIHRRAGRANRSSGCACRLKCLINTHAIFCCAHTHHMEKCTYVQRINILLRNSNSNNKKPNRQKTFIILFLFGAKTIWTQVNILPSRQLQPPPHSDIYFTFRHKHTETQTSTHTDTEQRASNYVCCLPAPCIAGALRVAYFWAQLSLECLAGRHS